MKVRVISRRQGDRQTILGVIPNSSFNTLQVGKFLLDKRVISKSDAESIEVSISTDLHFEDTLGVTHIHVEVNDGGKMLLEAELTELE